MKILIKNGTIFNGLEEPEKRGDILIENEIIKKIETEKPIKEKVDKIIEATDYFVCPGFIDVNNESDHFFTLFSYKEQESALYQGITSIIVGNNGCSLAPILKNNLSDLGQWNSSKININWQTMDEFLRYLKKTRPFVNIFNLVGQTTIKKGIIDDEIRDLTDQELEKLKNYLDQSLKQGAGGLSCDLKYSYLTQTSFAELVMLAQLAKKHNKILVIQLRDQKDNLISSLEEIESLLDILGKDKCPKIEITHFYAYKDNIDEIWQGVALIYKLRQEGLDINFDLSPFTLISNPIYLYFPIWFRYGNFEMMLKNLKNKGIVRRLLDDFKQKKYDFSKIMVSANPNNIPFINGKSIDYLAKERGINPEEMFLEIFKMTKGKAIILSDELSWPETLGLLESDLSLVSTNSPTLNYSNFDFLPQPASFNTFLRFLSLVKEDKISLPFFKAINKITLQPATKFGFKKRGKLEKNYFADVVIFDPKEIKAESNFYSMGQKIQGLKDIIINGQLVIEDEKFLSNPSGRILELNG